MMDFRKSKWKIFSSTAKKSTFASIKLERPLQIISIINSFVTISLKTTYEGFVHNTFDIYF